jgi:hypothetical protein
MPQIIVFGQLTDLLHFSSIAISDVPDTDALREALATQFPSLATAKFAIAVDQQIVTTNARYCSGNLVWRASKSYFRPGY